MAKTLTEQIEDLQTENEKLKEYEKLMEKALKMEFGVGKAGISAAIKKSNQISRFEAKIRQYFVLKTEDDLKRFIAVMCTENTRNYYLRKLEEAAENTAAEEQG